MEETKEKRKLRQNNQDYWTLDELKEKGNTLVSLNERIIPATLIMKFDEKETKYWKIDGYWFPLKDTNL